MRRWRWTSYDGAFVERWPEAQEFMNSATGEKHLANSTGDFRETAQGRLAQAILILRTDGYRSGASRVQRVRDLVRAATDMAPQDPHVLLYAAMIMLDVRDLRQARQHVKSHAVSETTSLPSCRQSKLRPLYCTSWGD